MIARPSDDAVGIDVDELALHTFLNADNVPRGIQGWLRVEAEGLRAKRQLEPWVMRGVAYARSLPPKH